MDASEAHHVVKHEHHHPGFSRGKGKLVDTKLLEETRRLHDYLKKNLNEIANCIVMIKTKRNLAFERMTKEAEKLKKRKIDMLKEIQEKYRLVGDDVEKSMWNVVSSPNTPETTNSELKVKNKLCNKLKDLKIMSTQIRTLQTEIYLMNEQFDAAMEELYGKERMLDEVKGSLDNVLQKIRVLTLELEKNEEQVQNSISMLNIDKSTVSNDKLLSRAGKKTHLHIINATINLEEERGKKYVEEFNMKLRKLNRKSLIKHELMLQLYKTEIKDLQSRKKKLTLTPAQIALIDERLDNMKLEMFYVELNEYHRLLKITTNLLQLNKLEDKFTALRENINQSGGLKYKDQVYFIDKRGRFFYEDKDGVKIYKEQITSTLLYQLDSLQNLVLINKKPIKPKVVVPVPVVKEKRVVKSLVKREEKLTAEERVYFKKELGLHLAMGLSHVTMNRPNNPLAYLGHFLTMYNKMVTVRGIERRDAKEIVSDLIRQEDIKEQKINKAKLLKIATLSRNTPIMQISADKSFSCLNEREKRYCLYLCKASFLGKLLLSSHSSSESALTLILLHKIYSVEPVEELKTNLHEANLTDDEIQNFLLYSAAVLTSCGVYKYVARKKMIPGIRADRFLVLVRATQAFKADPLTINHLLKFVTEKIYNPIIRESLFGTHNMFLSHNMTPEDIDYVKEYLARHNQIFYHKAIAKEVQEGERHIFYIIVIDSILKDMQSDLPLETIDDGGYTRTFKAIRGRSSTLLMLIHHYLKEAIKYADYNSQRFYLKNIMNYFVTGNSYYNVRASIRLLTSDPPIQIYFGYTQHWEDKNFTVGEIGNIVVVRNREKMKRDKIIIKNTPNYIKFLPWSADFEHRVFKNTIARFVDVLQYASFSLKSVLSVPYHPNLRKKYGAKPLFVANYFSASENVRSGNDSDKRVQFLNPNDLFLYNKYYTKANTLLIDLTLLIGMGSGKLFKENELRVLNFPKTLKNPITDNYIKTKYTFTDTFTSKFGENAEIFKYFRAVGIALYSSLNENLFNDLNMSKEEDDVVYVLWLIVIYHGLFKSVHDYDFTNEKWKRTDDLACFMIARYLLDNCGKGMIHLEEMCSENGDEPDHIELILNRKKIFTIGKKVIGKLITELTVIKATGDVEAATVLITKWTSVSDVGAYPLKRWYTKYISKSYVENYKISITPVTFLVKNLTKDVTRRQSDEEDDSSDKFSTSESESENIGQGKAKKVIEIRTVDHHHIGIRELDLHSVKKLGITLEDDTLDEDSDDETPERVPMPTDGHVELRNYPATPEGAITSFMDAIAEFPNVMFMLEEIWADQLPRFSIGINLNTNPIECLTFEDY